MADDLDAFLDEIDTLDESAAPGIKLTDTADTATTKGPAVVSAAAVISKPPAKAAEPTKSVFASRPVRNEDVQQKDQETAPSFTAQTFQASFPRPADSAGGFGQGPPSTMMHQNFGPNSHGPPPMHPHQPPPMHHVLPQQPMPAPSAAAGGANQPEDKKRKTMRMAADKIWEDESLADWPTDDCRLFCGNLGNEVDDSTLARTFNKYPSFQKAKVIRDQRTKKSKGYGFVSLGDPADFTKAIRELNGKYVGNRPIKLSKSEWQERQLATNIKKRPKMKPSQAKKHIL